MPDFTPTGGFIASVSRHTRISQPNHAYSAQLAGVRLEGVYTLEQASLAFPRHTLTQIQALCDNCKAYLKSGE
ncbi:MAG: hypothetical protein ACOY0S_04565 [Patescibacteria group bacterium]